MSAAGTIDRDAADAAGGALGSHDAEAADWSRWRHLWPNHAHSGFVRAGGVRWHVQVAGRGPAVLLVHGTAGGTHSWHRVLPRLAERHTVIAPDLPGHAFSSHPAERTGLTLPGMARALAALLATLGVAPRLVVGHSAGAAVLLRMALDGALPEARRLVGLNAAVAPPPALAVLLGRGLAGAFASARVARWASRLARHTDATARLLLDTGSTVPPEIVRCYELLTGTPAHVRAALTMMSGWDVAALADELHRVRIPTVLLAARDDRWVPPRATAQVARLLPDARFELVEGHGHLMHEEAGDQSAERLLQEAREAERREPRRSDADGVAGDRGRREVDGAIPLPRRGDRGLVAGEDEAQTTRRARG